MGWISIFRLPMAGPDQKCGESEWVAWVGCGRRAQRWAWRGEGGEEEDEEGERDARANWTYGMGHEPQTPWSELLRCSCQSHNCNRAHAVNPQHLPLSLPISRSLPSAPSHPSKQYYSMIPIVPSLSLPTPAAPAPTPTRAPFPAPPPRAPPTAAALPTSPDETAYPRPHLFRCGSRVGRVVGRSYGHCRPSAISHQIFSMPRPLGSQQRAFTPTVQRASFEACPSSSRSRLLTWSFSAPAFALSTVGTPACPRATKPCLPVHSPTISARSRVQRSIPASQWSGHELSDRPPERGGN